MMNGQQPNDESSGVFISYRRADTAGYAGRLFDSLRERLAPRPVFMDIDTIEPGADFVEVVERAVSNWGVLLALIGPRWLTVTMADGTPRLNDPEDFVRREIGTARARNVRVIPLLVGGATMPPTNALPDDLKPLTRRHGLEITDARWHYDVARLVEALERHWSTASDRQTAKTESGTEGGPVTEVPSSSVPASSPTQPVAPAPVRPPTAAEPAPGLRLGSFELLERVAFGAASEVWKAYDAGLDRLAAISLPLPQFVHDAELRGRFKHDAQAIAALSHPNILPIWEIGELGMLLYVASPFVESNLSRRLRAPWTPAELLQLLGALASAIDFLHERGFFLASFKPADVLLTGRGTVLLRIFDISRTLRAFDLMTPAGMAIGSPEFFAPEEIAGRLGGLQSNVYRLGLIAYELVTGRHPFDGENPVAIMYRQMNEAPPPPTSFVASLPSGVDAVLLRALAKDPADRFPSAGQFVQELRAALFGPTTSPSGPGTATASVAVLRVPSPPLTGGPRSDDRVVGGTRTVAWPFLVAIAVLLVLGMIVGRFAFWWLFGQ